MCLVLLRAKPSDHYHHLLLEHNSDGKAPIGETALRLSDRRTESLAGLGHTYAVMGRRSKAEGLLAELEACGQQKYISPFYHALIYAGLGESDLSQREKAIEYLERPATKGSNG
jgi:tetratricopeptide (TPR) repeat protein